MTEAKQTRVYKGSGYWITQIVFSLLMIVLCGAGGAYVLFAPPNPGDEAGPGAGVVMLLVAIAFLFVLIWLIKQFAGSTKEQRAVYAWAIMQQHSRNVHDGRMLNAPQAVGNDVAAMSVAKKARNGQLSRAEIDRLQALRPEAPYPGKMPPA
ncbi:hypothetical protein [Saccharopolyspora sp. NPDC050642]|uniref:hypothetical protein n=1 Tax=Saccharopolyspora sp. NPDC050642 TaxID=3157099 RepID=UPI0034041CE4